MSWAASSAQPSWVRRSARGDRRDGPHPRGGRPQGDTSALLRDLLEAEGYEVESALTGEQGLDALAQNPDVDLVVLDLMLPGMSGYDVIERLRSSDGLASIPVLVLSALSSTSARIRGLRDGADDYMTKPFLPEELLARTRTLVTGRLLERRTRELQALAQIAQASLTAANADVLLQRIVEITAEVFGADIAVLFLPDEGGVSYGRGRRSASRSRSPSCPSPPRRGRAASR